MERAKLRLRPTPSLYRGGVECFWPAEMNVLDDGMTARSVLFSRSITLNKRHRARCSLYKSTVFTNSVAIVKALFNNG